MWRGASIGGVLTLFTLVGVVQRCSAVVERHEAPIPRARFAGGGPHRPRPPGPLASTVAGAVHRGKGVLALGGLPVRLRKAGVEDHRTHTDAWGRFAFRDVPPGPFEIAFRSEDHDGATSRRRSFVSRSRPSLRTRTSQ